MSTNRSAPAIARRAMSLTELLIVIAVITVLLGILLPVLGAVRVAGHETQEMSAGRQAMLGYLAYATDQRDRLMPGKKRKLPARDSLGKRLTGEAAARYLWRLAPYLDYNVATLFAGEQRSVFDALYRTDPAELGESLAYLASLSPSLGINGTFIGGNEHENELGFDEQYIDVFGEFYVTGYAQLVRPERLIIFASARGEDPLTSGTRPSEGYFMVTPPRLAAIDGERWSEAFDPDGLPSDFGFVSPRYDDEAVIAFADGHTGTLAEPELRDMRHWANQAKTADFALVPR